MNEYTVTINGVDHTMQLDAEDAKRLDAKPVASKEQAPAKNKARAASNKSKG